MATLNVNDFTVNSRPSTPSIGRVPSVQSVPSTPDQVCMTQMATEAVNALKRSHRIQDELLLTQEGYKKVFSSLQRQVHQQQTEILDLQAQLAHMQEQFTLLQRENVSLSEQNAYLTQKFETLKTVLLS